MRCALTHSLRLAIAGLLAAVVAAGQVWAAEPRIPDATIVVSSSPASSMLGLTLVEGTLRLRGKTYLLALRGAQPSVGGTGKVYGLVQPRDIEGSYTPADGCLRNQRGVTIAFEPPLELSADSTLRIEIRSRMYPKGSTGQRGTVD